MTPATLHPARAAPDGMIQPQLNLWKPGRCRRQDTGRRAAHRPPAVSPPVRRPVTAMSRDTSATTPRDRALRLRALAEDGVLVLPNAWDAGSAAVIAAAGAPA